MGKVTRVSHDTEADIELKQGSANVFHPLHSLPEGKSYNIKVDERATYREYWCAVQPVQPNNTTAEGRVVFSSDDCTEFSKVRIYMDSTGKYTWEGTEQRGAWRNTPVANKASMASPVSTEAGSTSVPAKVSNPVRAAKPPTLWQRVTGVCRKK